MKKILLTRCLSMQPVAKRIFFILLLSSRALSRDADESIQWRRCILAKNQTICREPCRRIDRGIQGGCHIRQSLAPTTLGRTSSQNRSQNLFDVSVKPLRVQSPSCSCHCENNFGPILVHLGHKFL